MLQKSISRFAMATILLVLLAIGVVSVSAQNNTVEVRGVPLIEEPTATWPLDEVVYIQALNADGTTWAQVSHPRWGVRYVLAEDWNNAQQAAMDEETGGVTTGEVQAGSNVSCEFGARQEFLDQNATTVNRSVYDLAHWAYSESQSPYTHRTNQPVTIGGMATGDVVLVNGVISPLPSNFDEEQHTRQFIVMVDSPTMVFDPSDFGLEYFHNLDWWDGSVCGEDTLQFVLNYAATEPGLPGPESVFEG